jgi:hypothetical protein
MSNAHEFGVPLEIMRKMEQTDKLVIFMARNHLIILNPHIS